MNARGRRLPLEVVLDGAQADRKPLGGSGLVMRMALLPPSPARRPRQPRDQVPGLIARAGEHPANLVRRRDSVVRSVFGEFQAALPGFDASNEPAGTQDDSSGLGIVPAARACAGG